MLQKISNLILAIALLATGGCIANSTDDSLDHAEYAIEEGKPEKALVICDNLREKETAAEEKDVDALCRLSLLYMKIADTSEIGENIGYAHQCYMMAYEADSDKVKEFFNTLPVDDMAQGAMLKQLVRSTTMREQNDSILDEPYIDEPDSASYSYE